MSPGFRRLVVVVVLSAGVLAAIDLAVYWLVPAQRYAERVIDQLYAATGAHLTFRGRPHLSLFPRLALELSDVEVTATPGTTLAPLAAVDELHLQFSAAAFLRGELRVDEAVLFDPVLTMVVGPTGARNWALTRPPAEGGPREARRDAGSGGMGSRFRFDDIRVINGTLAYVDQRLKVEEAVTPVNGRIFVPTLDGPLSADGYFPWHGSLVQIECDFANTRHLLSGQPTKVAFSLSADAGVATYRGTARVGAAPAGSGELEIRAPSYAGLMEYLMQRPQQEAEASGPATVYAALHYREGHLRVSDVRMDLGGRRVAGEAALRLGAQRPELGVRLVTDQVNLTPLFPAADAPARDAETEEGPHYLAAPMWSDTPIGLGPLGATDANIEVYADAVRLRGLMLGPNKMTATIAQDQISVDVGETTAGDGFLRVTMNVDRTGEQPRYVARVHLESVDVNELLHGLWGASSVTGTATGAMEFTGTGTSPQELVSCLQGYGCITIVNGALHGVDLSSSSGNLVRFVLRQVRGAEKRTPFRRMSGTFEIQDGVLYNPDLLLEASTLRLSGGGATSLLDRSLDYRLALRRPWMRVPLAIQGTWGALEVDAAIPRPLPSLTGGGQPPKAPAASRIE